MDIFFLIVKEGKCNSNINNLDTMQCEYLILFLKVHWFWTRCENIFAITFGVKINSLGVCVTMVVSTSLDYLYQCDITHEKITSHMKELHSLHNDSAHFSKFKMQSW